VVAPRLDLQHSHAVAFGHETQRRTRNVHANFDLRTNGDPLDESAQEVSHETVPLVAPVETHLVSEQARRDAEADRKLRCRDRFTHLRTAPETPNTPFRVPGIAARPHTGPHELDPKQTAASRVEKLAAFVL